MDAAATGALVRDLRSTAGAVVSNAYSPTELEGTGFLSKHSR